jgi:hypothetical protein
VVSESRDRGANRAINSQRAALRRNVRPLPLNALSTGPEANRPSGEWSGRRAECDAGNADIDDATTLGRADTVDSSGLPAPRMMGAL